ncbi:MAG: tryptophan-rich sensory protein [Candidatus Thorarchaeota archaeon]
MSKKPNILQVVNILAIVITIIVNAIAEIIPVNGVTSKEVSDSYPSLFTPPGYVFSIWSVIYTLLIVFMIYQVRSSQREAAYLRPTALFFVLGGLINTSWLILFHYSYGQPGIYAFTPILIGLFLVLMLYTYVKLDIGAVNVPTSLKIAVHLPISVYAGWVSLAVIANIASALNTIIPGIPQSTQELWTASVIIVALAITLLMLVNRRDAAFGLVVVWATTGIATNQSTIPIIYFAAMGSAVIIILAILLLPIITRQSFRMFYLRNED